MGVGGRWNHVDRIAGAVRGTGRQLGGEVKGVKEGINGGFLG